MKIEKYNISLEDIKINYFHFTSKYNLESIWYYKSVRSKPNPTG